MLFVLRLIFFGGVGKVIVQLASLILMKNENTLLVQILLFEIFLFGFIFLQETNSSVKDEKVWIVEFEGQFFFSHGKTNPCDVATGSMARKTLKILKFNVII